MNILERRVNALEALSINRLQVVIVRLPWQTEEQAIQEWMVSHGTTEPPIEIDYMIQINGR
jgi:hypothetical protein